MTLLDTFIRAKNEISQLCDRVKPVDPPEDNYDFIVVGGEYFPLLILSLHRATRFGLFPIGCSATSRLYLTFDTVETVYFVASKTVTRRGTVWETIESNVLRYAKFKHAYQHFAMAIAFFICHETRVDWGGFNRRLRHAG